MQLMELVAHVLMVSIIPHRASSYRNWTPQTGRWASWGNDMEKSDQVYSNLGHCSRDPFSWYTQHIPHVLLLYLKCVEQTAPFLFAP